MIIVGLADRGSLRCPVRRMCKKNSTARFPSHEAAAAYLEGGFRRGWRRGCPTARWSCKLRRACTMGGPAQSDQNRSRGVPPPFVTATTIVTDPFATASLLDP
jgi:hypothetical protein